MNEENEQRLMSTDAAEDVPQTTKTTSTENLSLPLDIGHNLP